jgi:hypothetical protein
MISVVSAKIQAFFLLASYFFPIFNSPLRKWKAPYFIILRTSYKSAVKWSQAESSGVKWSHGVTESAVSPLRLDQFDHIRSLDLTGVSNASFLQVINRLIQSMPQLALTLYKIKDGNTDFPAERIENFIRLILTLQNIRHVSLYEPNVLFGLESAVPTIENICLESITIREMQKLKTYRPNLRFFSVKQIK